MTQAAFDIDLVVREVLRELELATAATVAAPAPPVAVPPSKPAPAQPVAKTPPAAIDSSDLVVTLPVVTLSALSGRLDGVRQVVVVPGAVVTPAVYDELYRRNVALSFASPEVTPKSSALRLVLVAAGKKFDPAQLVGALRSMALAVETTSMDCLMAASDHLAQELAKPNTLGVLVTRHVPAALCLTNRLAGVRAIAPSDAGKVVAAAEAVGANLLLLDPHCGLFTMKRMVNEFCRDGVRECPEVFRKRLA